VNLSTMVEKIEPFIAELLAKTDGTKYSAFYIEPGPNMTREQAAGFLQIYTVGILERSHLACVTLLARSHRWLKSCRIAAGEANALSFAASLRGLLESAADGFDLMRYLPATLAQDFEKIYPILNTTGRNFTPVIMAELEERLIHYAFATRPPKGNRPLPHHTAKSNSDYIGELEKFGVSRLKNLYAELCALTHPSADSVRCFIDETPRSMTFVAQKDNAVIEKLLTEYEECITSLVEHSITPALVSLVYLHRLNPHWVAPEDSTISHIGRTSQTLRKMDEFMDKQSRTVVH
jgi:hypothetical protein